MSAETGHPRLLRGARRFARRRRRRRSRRRSAGSPASCTPTSTATTPRPRTSSRRRPRPTRCCPIPSAARRTTATATRGCAAAAALPTSRRSGRSRTSSRRSSAARARSATCSAAGAGRRAPFRAATWRSRAEISLADALHGTTVEVSYEVGGACASTAAETAPSRARRSRRARAARAPGSCARCQRTPFGQVMRTDGVRHLPRRRPRPARAVRGVPRTRPQGRAPEGVDRHPGRDRRRPADPDHGPRPRRRARRAGRRPVRADPRARGLAVPARRRRPRHRGRRRGAAGRARARRSRSRPSTARPSSRSPPGPSRTRRCVIRGAGMPALRGRRTGDLRVVVNVVVPRHLNREQRELLEQLADSMTDHNLRTDEGVFGKLKRAFAAAAERRDPAGGPRPPRPGRAGARGAARAGAGRRRGGRRRRRTSSSTRSTARPGSCRRCPISRRRPAGALVEVLTRRSPTTGRSDGASFTGRVVIGDRLTVRPPWEAPGSSSIDLGDRSRPGVRDRRARDHAAVPGAAARAAGARAARSSTSAAARVCSRSRPRVSATRRCWRSTTTRRACGPRAENAARQRRRARRAPASTCAPRTCRRPGRWRRTCWGRCCVRGRRGWRCLAWRVPRRVIASGLLVAEADADRCGVRCGRACARPIAASPASGARCCSSAPDAERAEQVGITAHIFSSVDNSHAAESCPHGPMSAPRPTRILCSPCKCGHIERRWTNAQPARDRRDSRWPAPRRRRPAAKASGWTCV